MFKLQANKNIVATALNTINLEQQIRHFKFRKAPWLPRSKRTVFRVPPLKVQDPKQKAYIIPIWNEYKSQMRSIYQLFKTEAKFSDKESLKVKEEKRIVFEKEQQVLKKNMNLNQETLKIQLVEEEERLKENLLEAEKKFIEKLKVEELYQLEAEKTVKKLKEKVKTFIDPSNLEFEIEKMLNERVDHNFSIDSSGHFFRNKVRITRMQAFDQKYIPKPKETEGTLVEETFSSQQVEETTTSTKSSPEIN